MLRYKSIEVNIQSVSVVILPLLMLQLNTILRRNYR
jgi:hypothetical protein